jgi:type IV pilus assembly protein PilC
MPLYQYRALNQNRNELQGELEAGDPDQALAEIREMGLFATSLREKFQAPSSPPGKEPPKPEPEGPTHPPLFSSISLKQLIYFTRQFATMQEAGLPILKSLQLLENQQRPGPLRRVLRDMIQDIKNGTTLGEAIEKHPGAFNELYVQMVRAGEMGGVLEPILLNVAEAMERQMELRRKIIKACLYPAFVVTFAFLIFLFMMFVVLPIAKTNGLSLPGPFQTLDHISEWIRHGTIPGWLLMVVVPVTAFLGLKILKKSSGFFRSVIDRFKLHIPIVGKVCRKLAVSRFSRVLGTLVGAGVPIVDAMKTSRKVAGNAVFSQGLEPAQEAMRAGKGITASIQACRVFDPTVINMIEVGEETGELDKMLLKIADNYEADAEALITYATNLLGPALIAIVAISIGYIIVSMYIALLGGFGI